MTTDEYNAIPALRSSIIKAMRRSPLHAHHEATHEREPTPAMRMGTLMHAAVLEPAVFAARVAVSEVKSKNANAWKDLVAEHGDFALMRHELATLSEMSAAVHANPQAHALVSGTDHEQSHVWDDPECGACKCRWDGISRKIGVVEIKTSQSWPAAQDDAQRHFDGMSARMGYPIQLGWYTRGAKSMLGVGEIPCTVIWIQQTAPHDVCVLPASFAALDWGEREAVNLARRYRVCEESGEWPGVQSALPADAELGLPDWLLGDALLDMSGALGMGEG